MTIEDKQTTTYQQDVFSQTTGSEVKPAGFIRRIGAMIYDTLLVTAICMIATVPFLPFLHGRVLVPQEVGWPAYLYRAWIAVVIVLFFGFFWSRRGQTVGMQAWRLRVEDERGGLLTWPMVLKRLMLTMLPWIPSFATLMLAESLNSPSFKQLGYALLLLVPGSVATLWLTPERRTWYDRLTQQRVVVKAKQ